MTGAEPIHEPAIDYARDSMPVMYPVWRAQAYALWAPYVFEVDGVEHTAPAGFRFEASIPRFFWRVRSPWHPDVARAAVIHDFLYRHRVVPRVEADALFYRTLLEDGVPPSIAFSMHRAVRMFGGAFYGRDDG